MIGRPEKSLIERFKTKYTILPSGCWHWNGAKDLDGYGFIKRKDGKQLRAHRFSYEHYKGPIGVLQVCHTCDNTSYVNPDHLFLGTLSDNMKDAFRKGRKSNAGIKNPMYGRRPWNRLI